MNISIGEKKVFGGVAPRQVWLKDYYRPGGMTHGVPMSLALCWAWRTPLDTCMMGESPTKGVQVTLVACPDERGDHVQMSYDVGRCATGVISEVLELTHGCDGAHEGTWRFIGMGHVEVMW